MPKVYAVVRCTREKTLDDCIASLEIKGFDYSIIKNKDTLETKTKEIIRKGIELKNNYDWIMAIDADVIISLNKQEMVSYCNWQEKKTKINRFWCFTGWLDCTARGLIAGLHFYKTKYCKEAYGYIKDKDFQFHKGREEYEIVKFLQDKHNLRWDLGYRKKPMGVHLFKINNV